MRGTSSLYLVISFIASGITAFQWSPVGLEDNGHLYACLRSDVTLSWSFNKTDVETVTDVQWFLQRDGSTKEALAGLVAGHFFTDDDDVEHVQPAGLHISHVNVNHSGNYSVIVHVQQSGGLSMYTRSAVLSAVEPPVFADGHFKIQQHPDVLEDEKTGKWFVQLQCGRVTSLGQPPVTVRWTTPSGQIRNSSSFDNGSFILNLPDPVETGHYSCALDNDTETASCLDACLFKTAQLRLDGDTIRLQILEAQNKKLTEQNHRLEAELQNLTAKLQHCTRLVHSCVDVQRYRTNQSGVAIIHLPGDTPLNVYCDQDTDGGGWTVFQRRMDGSVDFYRNWTEYQRGFGNLSGEFWLGLDSLHTLTSSQTYELRVDLTKWDGTKGFATFSNFSISDASDNYRLHFDNFTGGNAGDSLSYSLPYYRHEGQEFSTWDADHDSWHENCAQSYRGGWWYNNCHVSNLNGDYKYSSSDPQINGLTWKTFGGWAYSMKFTEMKIRPT